MTAASTITVSEPVETVRICSRSLSVPTLPEATRIYVGHDYKAPGREVYAWQSTVGEQKARNVHVGGGKPKADFIAMRQTRDATLAMPRLIIPSLQVNMRAGHMPEPEEDGNSYLKVPLNRL